MVVAVVVLVVEELAIDNSPFLFKYRLKSNYLYILLLNNRVDFFLFCFVWWNNSQRTHHHFCLFYFYSYSWISRIFFLCVCVKKCIIISYVYCCPELKITESSFILCCLFAYFYEWNVEIILNSGLSLKIVCVCVWVSECVGWILQNEWSRQNGKSLTNFLDIPIHSNYERKREKKCSKVLPERRQWKDNEEKKEKKVQIYILIVMIVKLAFYIFIPNQE